MGAAVDGPVDDFATVAASVETELRNLARDLRSQRDVLKDANESLQQSRAQLKARLGRYSSFFELAPALCLIVGVDGQIEEMSRTGEQWLGVAPGFAIGSQLAAWVVEADRPAVEKLLIQAVATPGPESDPGELRCEVTLQGAGQLRERRVRLKARFSPQESGILILGTDISEQTRTESALRKIVARYGRAVRGANEGLWDRNLLTGDIYLSYRCRQLLGIEGEDLNNFEASLFARIHPEDFSRVKEAAHRHIELHEPYDIEFRLRMSDGTYRWFRSRGEATWDDDAPPGSKPHYLSGAVTDITAQKSAETLLRRAEASLETAQGIAQLGSWDFWPETGAGWWSQEMYRLFGRDPAKGPPPMADFVELIHPNDRERFLLEHAAIIESGSDARPAFRSNPARGPVRHFTAAVRCIRNPAGVVTQLTGTVQEVTELNQMQAQLREAKEAAEAASEAKSEFLAVMSHEIRTPMNGILGFTDLLQQTTLDADQERFVRHIQHSGEALVTIINDILDFSKIEAGKLELESVPLDLAATAAEAVAFLAPSAREKGIDLVLDYGKETTRTVTGDAGRIRQVLLNLISNGIKFTSKGSVRVEIRLSSADRLRVSVIDTGPGIDPGKRPLLFRKFSQIGSQNASLAARQPAGTGLGLAISKRLVELMGGEIGMDSRMGEGSTFWFTLPVQSV
jgi:PAS domain S-box-containing protein